MGSALCGEEYITEYKRLFKAAHAHGVIASRLPGLYLSVDDAGADYIDCILKPSFVSAKSRAGGGSCVSPHARVREANVYGEY